MDVRWPKVSMAFFAGGSSGSGGATANCFWQLLCCSPENPRRKLTAIVLSSSESYISVSETAAAVSALN